MKDLEWIASSLEDLKKFPRAVQRDIGLAPFRVQQGDTPQKAKRMKGMPGVYEIRSDFMTDTYRAVYAVKISDKIYVLHVFQKKSKSGIATPQAEIDVIRKRLKTAREIAKEEIR